MDISTMTIEELETRKSELMSQIDGAENDEALNSIESELNSIEERKKEIRLAEFKAEEEERNAVANGEGEVILNSIVEETRTMTDVKEIRNSQEYVEAFANFIKTNKDEECRALLTENVEGTIAVPDFVYDVVKTAWDKDEIMSLVNKVSIAGNLKVNFEISGTDAVVHTEGTGAIDEEVLTEGIVTLVPAFIKKWISISDEVMSMRGEAFLRYIYAELTMKITKKIADQLIALIVALPTSATATSPAASKIEGAPSMSLVAEAIGNLSDEANNPVIIMNKLTWSAFKAVQYANNYGVDPFEGLKVVFNNTLPAYSAANASAVYMIVGDLGNGALANFPNGDSVKIIVDETTLATSDLVRVIGKEYVGLGIVNNKAFVNVTKPASV